MTVLTNGGSQYVCIVLTGRICAVVATGTIAGNARMVEICRRPGDGCVAIVAVVTTCEMSGVLSGGGDAIVTRTATAQYLCMIHIIRWQPGD